MTSTIRDIQCHLEQYKSVKSGVPLDRLSLDEVSILKGCHVKRSQEHDYKRSWAKLAKAQRLNRLMNYHQKLSKDYQLDSDNQHQLKTLFYDGVGSGILDRDNVNYDMSEGSIVNIEILKRDADGIFYFDRTNSKDGTSSIQTIKKFTPIPTIRLAVNKPIKPVIVKKPLPSASLM